MQVRDAKLEVGGIPLGELPDFGDAFEDGDELVERALEASNVTSPSRLALNLLRELGVVKTPHPDSILKGCGLDRAYDRFAALEVLHRFLSSLGGRRGTVGRSSLARWRFACLRARSEAARLVFAEPFNTGRQHEERLRAFRPLAERATWEWVEALTAERAETVYFLHAFLLDADEEMRLALFDHGAPGKGIHSYLAPVPSDEPSDESAENVDRGRACRWVLRRWFLRRSDWSGAWAVLRGLLSAPGSVAARLATLLLRARVARAVWGLVFALFLAGTCLLPASESTRSWAGAFISLALLISVAGALAIVSLTVGTGVPIYYAFLPRVVAANLLGLLGVLQLTNILGFLALTWTRTALFCVMAYGLIALYLLAETASELEGSGGNVRRKTRRRALETFLFEATLSLASAGAASALFHEPLFDATRQYPDSAPTLLGLWLGFEIAPRQMLVLGSAALLVGTIVETLWQEESAGVPPI